MHARAEKPMQTFVSDEDRWEKCSPAAVVKIHVRSRAEVSALCLCQNYYFGCHQQCCTIRYGIVRRIRI